jgi:hypothetical protein
MDDARDARAIQANAVAEYKRILSEVLDVLPSGTRKRLAAALGKNRSFITQISNPAYSVPIPARHVDAVLDLCHFPPDKRQAFLDAYHRAHPRWHHSGFEPPRLRQVSVLLPDLGDAASNRELEGLVRALAQGISRLAVHQIARRAAPAKDRKRKKETPP